MIKREPELELLIKSQRSDGQRTSLYSHSFNFSITPSPTNEPAISSWINPHFPSIVDIQCGEKAILL